MRDSDPSNDSISALPARHPVISLRSKSYAGFSIRTEHRNREEKAALLERPNEENWRLGEATLLQVCTYGYKQEAYLPQRRVRVCGFALNRCGSVESRHQENSRVFPRSGTAEVEQPASWLLCY